MKKVISIILVLSFLFVSTSTVFYADSNKVNVTNQSENINNMAESSKCSNLMWSKFNKTFSVIVASVVVALMTALFIKRYKATQNEEAESGKKSGEKVYQQMEAVCPGVREFEDAKESVITHEESTNIIPCANGFSNICDSMGQSSDGSSVISFECPDISSVYYTETIETTLDDREVTDFEESVKEININDFKSEPYKLATTMQRIYFRGPNKISSNNIGGEDIVDICIKRCENIKKEFNEFEIVENKSAEHKEDDKNVEAPKTAQKRTPKLGAFGRCCTYN